MFLSQQLTGESDMPNEAHRTDLRGDMMVALTVDLNWWHNGPSDNVGAVNDPHITLAYLPEVSIHDETLVKGIIESVYIRHGQIEVETDRVDQFNIVQDDGTIPQIVRIKKTPQLVSVREEIVERLKHGIRENIVSEKFDFNPHVTIRYVTPGTPLPLAPGGTWRAAMFISTRGTEETFFESGGECTQTGCDIRFGGLVERVIKKNYDEFDFIWIGPQDTEPNRNGRSHIAKKNGVDDSGLSDQALDFLVNNMNAFDAEVIFPRYFPNAPPVKKLKMSKYKGEKFMMDLAKRGFYDYIDRKGRVDPKFWKPTQNGINYVDDVQDFWESNPYSIANANKEKEMAAKGMELDMLATMMNGGKAVYVKKESCDPIHERSEGRRGKIRTSKLQYVHFTDAKGALGMVKRKELDKCSYTDGVYAIAVGGVYVPSVQRTKMGRAKSRDVAILFTTDELPDIADVEEVIWHKSKIRLKTAKIIPIHQAIRLLDGRLVKELEDWPPEELRSPVGDGRYPRHPSTKDPDSLFTVRDPGRYEPSPRVK